MIRVELIFSLLQNGIASLIQALPSVTISQPTSGQRFLPGEVVKVSYAVLCGGAGPCVDRILVLLDDRIMASFVV